MKKDVFIFSKREFEDTMKRFEIYDSNVEKYENIAFISILCPTDYDTNELFLDVFSDNEHWFKNEHQNVLNIDFWDIEKEIEYGNGKVLKPFTPEQADEILNFIDKNQGKEFLIHCHAGISRSSAVAYFIRDYYEWVNKELFDRRYKGNKYPNQCVFTLLKKAFEKKYYV